MDEKTIFSYLAGKVIEDIREGSLQPDIAEALHIYPLNDYIRPLLKNDDIKSMLLLLLDENPKISAFAAMMSRPLQKDPRIRAALTVLWEFGRNEIIVGFVAIYRLLEYEDVTVNKRDEFFKFIRDNWVDWKHKLIASYPEPERILPGAKSRLANPDFPEWKKWIYLVEIACSPDNNEAREFLEEYDPGNDRFIAEVRSWALSQLLENDGLSK